MKLIGFSFDMISAQQLPQPRNFGPDEILDPYVEIEMFSADDKSKGVAWGEGGTDASARDGMSGIGSPHRRRTRVAHSNGYNPIFNESFKLLLKTKYPELVFVRWTVWNSQDGRNYNNSGSSDPLATFTAKLSSLEEGYRHLPLFDHNGDQFLFATLFGKVKKEEPITVEKDDDPVAEKMGRFRQLGQSVFKRTSSVDKRNGHNGDQKGRKGLERKSMQDE
jgi:phosphatidylinositol phospholipase C delta